MLFATQPAPLLIGLLLGRSAQPPEPGTYAAHPVSEQVADVGYWSDPGFIVAVMLFTGALLTHRWICRGKRLRDVLVLSSAAVLVYIAGPLLTLVLPHSPQSNLLRDIEFTILLTFTYGHGLVAAIIAVVFAIWVTTPRPVEVDQVSQRLRQRYGTKTK